MCKLSNKINQTIVLIDSKGHEHIIISDITNVYLNREVITGSISLYNFKTKTYYKQKVVFSFISYLWRSL